MSPYLIKREEFVVFGHFHRGRVSPIYVKYSPLYRSLPKLKTVASKQMDKKYNTVLQISGQIKDDQNRRRPKLKMTKMEDEKNLRRPK